MSYYTGVVNSTADLRTAITNACTNEGWSWNAGTNVLSKDILFVQIGFVSTTDITFLGRTSAGTGDAPNFVAMGVFWNKTGDPVTYEISWPATYHIFIFTDPDEVYIVVNYDTNRYQWAAFGKSVIESLPGTGMWIGASRGNRPSVSDALAGMQGPVAISPTTGGTNAAGRVASCGALSLHSLSTSTAVSALYAQRNFWLHSNLDSQGWWLAQTLDGIQVGVRSTVPLFDTQPSSWSSEAALIPVRAYKVRPSNRISLIAEMKNCRHLRIDNYEPEEVITIGDISWKVFPWFVKSLSERDGSGGGATSSRPHSGTFGWAIRYEENS